MANQTIPVSTIKKFLRQYGRYIGAVALFVVLIVLIVNFTTEKSTSASAPAVKAASDDSVESYRVDKDKKINELIENYYTYYANGDIVNLETVAHPISDSEKSFIQMYAPYVESYENLSCYTKSGLSEGAYLVSVYLEIKFDGVETLAPGLDFFYVETDENGDYYINNLYSQYNSLTKEQETDPAISALITAFESQEDVVALQTDVQEQYETAVASDEALNTLINTSIADAYATWARTLNPANVEEVAEETPEEEPAQEIPIILVTTDRVNVRDDASTDGNLLETVDPGTEVALVSDMGNGWYNVTYNGKTGYILSDYLIVKESVATAETTDTAADTATDTAETTDNTTTAETATTTTDGPTGTIKLQNHDAVSVRETASSDGNKIGTAYTGESIWIIENESSGWSKVEWNGKTGYIRTDLLN